MPVCVRCGLNKFAASYNRCGHGLKARCRECQAKYNRRYKLTRGIDGMIYSTATEGRVGCERDAAEREIVLLIRRYEAVRGTPGGDRDAAYNALALRLYQHARPVSDGERQWSWSEAMGEITHRLLRREWRAPGDRHADPRRVARPARRGPGMDLLEV